MKNFTIGVIISTYNHPDWLEKTLWGYISQTRKADEVIIADDGSLPETRAMVEHYKHLLPIKYVWQKDEGFRKTRILNKALQVAESDFLIFTDQDCIPREDFVAVHEHFATPGYFLSGGYFKLTEAISNSISREDVSSQACFNTAWLRQHSQPLSIKMLKLVKHHSILTRLFNRLTPTSATWNGMNSSGWRKDILAAKGFDERMGYGAEDRELGLRLLNAQLKSKQIRYSAICLHLWHNRPYKNNETMQFNKQICRETKKSGITQTPYSSI